MSKKIFNLIDENFAHDSYSVAGRDSEHIIWDRGLTERDRPLFFSHLKMKLVDHANVPKELCYGWIFESRGIDIACYKEVEEYIPKFNKVFTHNSNFLKKYDNCKWIPGGGIWVGGRPDACQGEGNIALYNKTKLCSMVSSDKRMCDLHVKRIELIDSLKQNNRVETLHVVRPEDSVPPIRHLRDFMFSIVVENFIDELYFTEKILNCFATGTIPIYLGATNISQVFDTNGILQFKNIEELHKIVDSISLDLYYSKMESIKTNFNKVQEYKSIEDYIFKNYFN